MEKGLHHIAISVKDINASMHFYHELLGWPISRIVKNTDMNGCLCDAYYLQIPGSGELEFIDRLGKQVTTPRSKDHTGLHHFALEVDDPEPYYNLFKENGYEFEIPLCKMDQFGHYTCGVIDPDGIMVEFIANYVPEKK